MCDCVKDMNKLLAPHRIRVAQAIQITEGMGLVARTIVATEAATPGEKKPRKAPSVVASHCPFCGQPLPFLRRESAGARMTAPITTAAALALFCDPESIYPFKKSPFTIGQHVYATNGHWIVRVPLGGGQLYPEAEEAWPVKKGAPDYFAAAASNPWTDDACSMAGMALPEKATCHECNGTGTVFWNDCTTCDGRGCGECDGAGCWTSDAVGEAIPCFRCDSVIADDWTGVNVGCNRFSMLYLRALKAIPGCTFDPGADQAHGRFKFPLAEGGEAMGLLMPRVRD